MVGPYETTQDKSTAIDYVDLRLQYLITLPEGMTMSDVTWSWTLTYGSKVKQVAGVNSLPRGNNTYSTNVVVTNVPASTQKTTDFKAVLTISFNYEGVKYTFTQSDSAPIGRVIGDMILAYQTTPPTDPQAVAYIDYLSQYAQSNLGKYTPVI